MIVRILTDNQYRLDDRQRAEIERLDDALEAAMDANDNAAFESTLAQLIAHVRSAGVVVPASELVASDIILPDSDMSLDEARRRLHELERQMTAQAEQTLPQATPSGE